MDTKTNLQFGFFVWGGDNSEIAEASRIVCLIDKEIDTRCEFIGKLRKTLGWVSQKGNINLVMVCVIYFICN